MKSTRIKKPKRTAPAKVVSAESTVSAEGKAGVKTIPIAAIKDGGAQARVEMRVEIVNEYADDMLLGAVFPPIIVYHDGIDYWLADGFHRVEAARKIEREDISAEVRQGTARDAVLYGIGANAKHGLRRTQADKRRAVERLLTDPEWARWSDRKIAETAKVDHKTVGKIRRDLSGEIPTGKSMGGEIPRAHGKPNLRLSASRRSPHSARRGIGRGVSATRPQGRGGERCLTMIQSRRWRRPPVGRSRTCWRCLLPMIRSMPGLAVAAKLPNGSGSCGRSTAQSALTCGAFITASCRRLMASASFCRTAANIRTLRTIGPFCAGPAWRHAISI